MIALLPEVLRLERRLVGIDEETTGVDPKKSAIVELGLEIMEPGKLTREFRTLVNPLIPIPPAATAIHGITNAMVQACSYCGQSVAAHEDQAVETAHNFKPWPTFMQLSDSLLAGLTNCDFAGYNVRFDLRQLAEEFARAGKVWTYEGARVIDGHRLWQLAEGRTLTHAASRWLKPTASDQEIADALGDAGAHTALWDIKMSTRVVAAQLKACSHLPRDVQQLHDLQWPDWFDADGKLRWREDNTLALTFGKHRDVSLASVPRGYLQWVCDGDFSEVVKNVCHDALKRKFPTRS